VGSLAAEAERHGGAYGAAEARLLAGKACVARLEIRLRQLGSLFRTGPTGRVRFEIRA
jgi:hypothetical protein